MIVLEVFKVVNWGLSFLYKGLRLGWFFVFNWLYQALDFHFQITLELKTEIHLSFD